MKLNKLILKNIRSYEEEEISFREGSTLLSGDVGSGKTTILLAIEYALFGLQPGQKGAALLKHNADLGSVTLECTIDGQEIVIERVMKRSQKSVNQEYTAITINGAKEELSITELKTKILELLGYPMDFLKKNNLLYRYTVYTPQEEMKEIILEDPESRLDVLRHIFGIDRYKTIKENTALVALKLREYSRLLQAETKDTDILKAKKETFSKRSLALETEIAEKDRVLALLRDRRKEIAEKIKQLDEKVAERRTFQKEKEKTEIQIQSKTIQLEEQQREMKVSLKKLEDFPATFNEQEYESISKKVIEAEKNSAQLQAQYIEAASRMRSLELRKTEEAAKKDRVFKIAFCPTCLQDVSENHKHNIMHDVESKIAAFIKEYNEESAKADSINLSLQREKELIEKLHQQKKQLELVKIRSGERSLLSTRVAEIEKSGEQLKKDIEFLRDHLTILKQAALEFAKFDTQLKLEQEEHEKCSNEERKVEILLAGLRKERELTLKETSNLEVELAKKEALRTKALQVGEIEHLLSEDFTSLVSYIERNIMLALRREFSKLFNEWFSTLTTEAFTVRLDENFTPIILQGDYELDYSFLSGGERTAVALAYRLALNQLINSVFSKIATRDLLILDEPTDGFSEQQLDKVRDILQQLKVRQLILVSHEQKVEGFVDTIIKVKKEGLSSGIDAP